MNIRKRLGSYLLAGLIAISTFGSSLMSIPAYAGGASGAPGSANAEGDDQFGLDYSGVTPMLGVYLAGQDGEGTYLSDDNRYCTADDAREIIEDAGMGRNSLLTQYRDKGMFIFLEEPPADSKIATYMQYYDGTPAYLSLDDVKDRTLYLSDLDAESPDLGNILEQVKDTMGSESVTSGTALNNAFAKYRRSTTKADGKTAKTPFNEEDEWNDIILPILSKGDPEMLKEASDRYRANKPVTLIFEFYAKTQGNWYIPAKVVLTVGQSKNCWRADTAILSDYATVASKVGAAYGVWNIFVGQNGASKEYRSGAPTAMPAHYSNYNLTGTSTPYYPLDTGCVGGWCYFSLCNDITSTPGISIQATKKIETTGNNIPDDVKQGVIEGSSVTFGYTNGVSEEALKGAGVTGNINVTSVAKYINTNFASLSEITEFFNSKLEPSAKLDVHTSDSAMGAEKLSTPVDLKVPAKTKTYYFVYESSPVVVYAPPANTTLTNGPLAAGVLCVDTTGKNTQLTFDILGKYNSPLFENTNIEWVPSNNNSLITLKYTNSIDIAVGEPPVMDVQIAQGTIVDIDKYYIEGYPAEFGLENNKQLVYNKMKLVNGDKPSVARINAWHWDKSSINNDMDAIIKRIDSADTSLKSLISGADKNTKTGETGTVGTPIKFTASDKFDYDLTFAPVNQKGTFKVNPNYIKAYDISEGDLNVTDADEVIAAANNPQASIAAGETIDAVKFSDSYTETSDLPQGNETVTLGTQSAKGVSIADVETYLDNYSEYAKKYALYEAMVAQGSTEITKAIKYWTKSAAALYKEAVDELNKAKVAASKTPTGKVYNAYNHIGDPDEDYYFSCSYCGDYHSISSVESVALGFSTSSSNAAKAQCEENLNKLTSDSRKVAEEAKKRIDELSNALYKVAGWKFKCKVPYLVVTVSNLRNRSFTVYDEDGRVAGYVYAQYLPEYNLPDRQINWNPTKYGFDEASYESYGDSDYDNFLCEVYEDNFPDATWNAYSTRTYFIRDRYDGETYYYRYVYARYHSTYLGDEPATSGDLVNKGTKYFLVNSGSTPNITIASASSKTSNIPDAIKTLFKSSTGKDALGSIGGKLGESLKFSEEMAKTIAELETNRPYAEIRVTQAMTHTLTDYDNLFQAQTVPEYILAMRWKDQSFFMKNNTYLAQILDRNPKHIKAASELGSAVTGALLDVVPTSSGKSTILTMTEDKGSTLNYEVKTSSGTTRHYVPVSQYKYAVGTNYTDAKTRSYLNDPKATIKENIFQTGIPDHRVYYLIPNSNVVTTNLDSMDYIAARFGIYATTWDIDKNNELQRFIPSAEWKEKLAGTEAHTLLNTNVYNLRGAKVANKADAADVKTVSGKDYIVLSSNPYLENQKAKISYTRLYSGTTVNTADERYFFTWQSTANTKNNVALSVPMQASNPNLWNTSKAPYELEAILKGYIPQDKTPLGPIPTETVFLDENGEETTEEMASSGWGVYTREYADEHYNIFPLVKMAYYPTPSDNELAYTFVVGQKARELDAYVYYELGMTGDGVPVVNANALASSSKAMTLGNSVQGGVAPVAYSGTGVTVSYNGEMSFTFQSYALINKDANETYQNGWGNVISATAAHNEWLESLGAKPSTITQNGSTVSAYTLGYLPGSSITIRNKNNTQSKEDAWILSSDKVAQMYEDTSKGMLTDIDLEVIGDQLMCVKIYKGFTDPNGGVVKAGTYKGNDTRETLSKLRNSAPAVYRALDNLDIQKILTATFEANGGEAVKADVNGKTATKLKVNGDNWYNEYAYCLALRVQSTTMAMQAPVFTDKIPLELGPKTPANQDMYFSDGYGFVVQKFLVKFANEASADGDMTGGTLLIDKVWAKDRGATANNDLIIADVPVTSAH